MTEKNNFVYKPFLSLNLSDFSLSLCKKCSPDSPEKGHPPLSPEKGHPQKPTQKKGKDARYVVNAKIK